MGRSAKSASPAIRATETALPDRASASAQPTGPPPAMATSTSGSSTTANQCLDIADRFRCRCRQDFASQGRDDNVVLDAYARVPELLGYVVARPDVAARLYGHGFDRRAGLLHPAWRRRTPTVLEHGRTHRGRRCRHGLGMRSLDGSDTEIGPRYRGTGWPWLSCRRWMSPLPVADRLAVRWRSPCPGAPFPWLESPAKPISQIDPSPCPTAVA